MNEELTTQEDDSITITSENIITVIKHNNVGISIDYYRIGENEPFRMDQVWFDD